MKKITRFAVMVMMVFMMSSSAYAWTVTINSNVGNATQVRVIGEHLFWQQVDCAVNVPPHAKGVTCNTGGICPVHVAVGLRTYTINKLAQCKDTTLTIFNASTKPGHTEIDATWY